MRQLLYILFIILNTLLVPTVMAQDESDAFLFNEFKEASIYFSYNSISVEKVNYNVREKVLYFFDREDSVIKVASNTEQIKLIKVDNRNFILVKGALQEVLPTTPPIYVEYVIKVQTKAKDVGYGTKSQTASATSYTIVGQGGYLMPDFQKMEIKGFYNHYWIERNGDKKKFTSFKQLLKLYPKHKKILEGSIKDSNIDFNDVEAIVNLCLYAESLS